jgi:hypothetical protein
LWWVDDPESLSSLTLSPVALSVIPLPLLNMPALVICYHVFSSTALSPVCPSSIATYIKLHTFPFLPALPHLPGTLQVFMHAKSTMTEAY